MTFSSSSQSSPLLLLSGLQVSSKQFSIPLSNLDKTDGSLCFSIVVDIVDGGVKVVPEPPGPGAARLDVD